MIPDTFGERFLDLSMTIASVALSFAFLFIVIRLARGPTLPDRVIALDMLTAASIGLIALIGIRTGNIVYVDVAIGLVLVGFLATIALARFILVRGRAEFDGDEDSLDDAPIRRAARGGRGR